MFRVIIGEGRDGTVDGKQVKRLPGSHAHAFSRRFGRHISVEPQEAE